MIMQNFFKKIFYSTLLALVLIPAFVYAHQPRMIEGRQTIVNDPEISKAYYGQLIGLPDIFIIQATTSFDLYVNILVPDITGQNKDVSAIVKKDGKTFVILDSTTFQWTQMFEKFGYDKYWKGPEYKEEVEAGKYEIIVTSSENNSKYSLAIGEAENFDFKEIMNALTLVPQIKGAFFNESPINFIFSPFGWGLILVLYILAGISVFAYRFALKKIVKNPIRGLNNNIGTKDRLVRLAIGVALILFAITTTWSLILIFLSGVAFFEAIFGWCGFYAALGKSTCAIE